MLAPGLIDTFTDLIADILIEKTNDKKTLVK